VAFAATNAGGEIDVLDTAGYGPLTINKAISIVNEGSIAQRAGPPRVALVSQSMLGQMMPSACADLRLRGAGVGHNGIQFSAGKSLTIKNCVIRNFTSRGIEFASERPEQSRCV